MRIPACRRSRAGNRLDLFVTFSNKGKSKEESHLFIHHAINKFELTFVPLSPNDRLFKITFMIKIFFGLCLLLSFSLHAQNKNWMLAPFEKQDSANPCLVPSTATLLDPLRKAKVAWEEKDVFNP